MKKVAIIGLDSVLPRLLFSKLLDKLPNIKKLYQSAMQGSLFTCHPPITVPACMVMLTGKNPGKLGIYGFRHRKDSFYSDGYIVNSTHVKEPTVWEILASHRKKSVVLGVPTGNPPKQVDVSNVVSCFITTSLEKEFTQPPSLKKEILDITDEKYLSLISLSVRKTGTK